MIFKSLFSLLLILSSAFARTKRDELEYQLLGDRVVGGTPANQQQEWNFICSMHIQSAVTGVYSHACGGSIIMSNVVVSAAHCTEDTRSRRVRCGTDTHNDGGVINQIIQVFNHQNYSPFTLDNDITILRLADDFIWSSTIGMVLIPQQSAPDNDNALAWVGGWGTTASGSGQIPTLLLETEVLTVNHDICDDAYWFWEGITQNMLCAGVRQGGQDACQGDSGGPLVIRQNAQMPVLVGVVSWGMGCAYARIPGVYAKVSQYSNWIVETVQTFDQTQLPRIYTQD